MFRKRLTTYLTYFLCVLGGFSYPLLQGDVTGALDGYLFDYALKLRAEAYTPDSGKNRPNPVAIIAVDARSLADEQLASTPRALMGPVWANLIEVLSTAGAKAIVFDFLLAFSGNAIKSGYDTEFLRALSKNSDRIILGRSGNTLPARPYLGALRFDPKSLGFLEINRDADHVIRRAPAVMLESANQSLVAATIFRSTGETPETHIVLAPLEHPQSIPTYSLVDILRCAQTSPQELARILANRIVFIGSTLTEEDSKLTSARFISRKAPTNEARSACNPIGDPDAPVGAQSIPGVFIHAAAVDAWMQDRLTTVAPGWLIAIFCASFAFCGAFIGFRFRPWAIVLALVVSSLLAWGFEIGLLWQNFWLPAGGAILALAGSTIAAYGIRYWLEERQRRWIQHAFCHYLSPALVNQLAEHHEALELKGEYREVTIMFADLSGFTALSEKVEPKELMQLTNHYLGFITEAIHTTGGYVDKFIGDAVMAIWGAPTDDPDHASHAVQSALLAVTAIAKENCNADDDLEHSLCAKIGLYSGRSVLGNVGTVNRLNYTAIGEAVNIASRIEGLAGIYHCPVIIGGTTADMVDDDFLLLELDTVVVKGKKNPVNLFQPIPMDKADDPVTQHFLTTYGKALAFYRRGEFTQAAELWESLDSGGDKGPENLMALRARKFIASPPPEPWKGVWKFQTK